MRVLALEDQIVRIEWRLADGSTHVQEIMCPPKELRDVREWERRVSLPPEEIPLLRSKHIKK